MTIKNWDKTVSPNSLSLSHTHTFSLTLSHIHFHAFSLSLLFSFVKCKIAAKFYLFSTCILVCTYDIYGRYLTSDYKDRNNWSSNRQTLFNISARICFVCYILTRMCNQKLKKIAEGDEKHAIYVANRLFKNATLFLSQTFLYFYLWKIFEKFVDR